MARQTQSQKVLKHLKNSPFLKKAYPALLQQIVEHSNLLEVPKGKVLIQQGKANGNIYYLVKGEVSIKVDGKLIYYLNTCGDIFGEMSAITSQLPTASVEVHKASEVIQIPSFLMDAHHPNIPVELTHLLYQWFAVILSEKLDWTSQKAKMFETQSAKLESQQELLAKQSEEIRHSLESQRLISENLAHNIQELQQAKEQLEQKQIEQIASYRKLEELNDSHERLLSRLSDLQSQHFSKLQKALHELDAPLPQKDQKLIHQSLQEIDYIQDTFTSVLKLYHQKQEIHTKRILLAESKRKQQILSKMALGGTGMALDVVSCLEEGLELIAQNDYDLICTSADLIELLPRAWEYNPETRSVLMTSDRAPDYLGIIQRYPFLSNIIASSDQDRTFMLKNMITTVSKLVGGDLFGLEKYLSWGVEVKSAKLKGSLAREGLLNEMEDYFQHLGVRRPTISKCVLASEELLMNAVYDAPIDESGHPKYNHLPRTTSIELAPEEQGTFRYACDGLLAAVSVEDPFGLFDFETAVQYLQNGYAGDFRSMEARANKGGAGHGLYQVMEVADLLILNVKKHVKTEVIAIFNIDPNKPKKQNTTSFHYFFN